MKEQYLAQMRIKNLWNEEWLNASSMEGGKRYLATKEEAEEAIKKIKAKYDGTEKTEVVKVGVMGVSSKIGADKKVIETRIRRRYVSEWEEV